MERVDVYVTATTSLARWAVRPVPPTTTPTAGSRLVSGAWVGGEDRDIHFNSEALGQGANAALPIWAYYMKRVFADRSLGYSEEEKFDIPEDYDPCGRSNSGSGMDTGIEDVFE